MAIPEFNLSPLSDFEKERLGTWPDPVKPQSDSVAIVSGGLDSTTLVYDMLNKGYTPHLLSFNYGQRHKKELKFASYTAKTLNLRHDIVDLTGLTHLISNSALTTRSEVTRMGDEELQFVPGDIEVPEGHYAEDTMKATVVPNRNMIMISIAAGVAVNYKYRTIGIGVHAGDHFVYPDCRPEFISAICNTIVQGNEGFHAFPLNAVNGSDGDAIYAPFIFASKANIAYRALELGVPLHLTWSCYKGGERHCGRCGTCVERLEAINEAQVRWSTNNEGVLSGYKGADLTDYEDNEFWRVAIRNGN